MWCGWRGGPGVRGVRDGRSISFAGAGVGRCVQARLAVGISQASAWRGYAALFDGSLEDAAADAQAVLDLAAEPGEAFVSRAMAPALLAFVRLERGEPAAALELRGVGGDVPEASAWNVLL